MFPRVYVPSYLICNDLTFKVYVDCGSQNYLGRICLQSTVAEGWALYRIHWISRSFPDLNVLTRMPYCQGSSSKSEDSCTLTLSYLQRMKKYYNIRPGFDVKLGANSHGVEITSSGSEQCRSSMRLSVAATLSRAINLIIT
jgi:hypothetical protein